MTATDELRRLLDERGVEYDDSFGATEFYGEGDSVVVAVNSKSRNAVLYVNAYLTPEQAVEATLGRGTCKDVCASLSEFTCSACGFKCDLMSWISLFDGDEGRHRHHHHGTPNYCPNCGRKVVDA